MVDRAPEQLFFTDDGFIPNNTLPVLIYRGISFESTDTAASFELMFSANAWPVQWRSGIYDFHHYHSNAHEVLGVVKGAARVLLGGPAGQEVTVSQGDILILPAGTGHCCLEHSDDFLVVGGYPVDQERYDVQHADQRAYESSKQRIAKVPLPSADPLSGPCGALSRLWT